MGMIGSAISGETNQAHSSAILNVRRLFQSQASTPAPTAPPSAMPATKPVTKSMRCSGASSLLFSRKSAIQRDRNANCVQTMSAQPSSALSASTRLADAPNDPSSGCGDVTRGAGGSSLSRSSSSSSDSSASGSEPSSTSLLPPHPLVLRLNPARTRSLRRGAYHETRAAGALSERRVLY